MAKTSWKPAIFATGETTFYHNGQTFATEKEAYAAAKDIFMRWFAVKEYRADEVDIEVYPVTHVWDFENRCAKEKGE